ncbi:MAG: hypothetical protein O2798_04525 [Chloroflexi bacterium]|nr:hypothetical protein [Chloroflexota bacterium]
METSDTGGTGGATVRRRDADVMRAMPDVVRVFPNPSYWWQNASFALPLIVSVVSLAVGVIFRLTEALGFGLFGLVVTAIMVPVVLLTWRNTATSVVLTRSGAVALHEGKPIHSLDWSELRRIESVEYLGNQRYKLVHGEDERFMVIESEIIGGAELVDEAFALSGIPRQSKQRTGETS